MEMDRGRPHRAERSPSSPSLWHTWSVPPAPVKKEEGSQMTATPPFDLIEATIPEMQAALTTGAITSRALVRLYLDRIAAFDQQGPALNAISAVAGDALAQADALDAERRERGARGPLHGIPIIVKDNFDTADMQTAAGSMLLKGWVPESDATLVARLRAAGAIIIAKSNMHEWAWSWENVGSLFGQTRNPYGRDRVPGGSSGGTGAAVAAGFAAAGMGSDTCGSVRVPAAHNALAGLRPTQGLLSRAGIVPLSHTQDTAGPIARTVTDLAVLMDVLAGPDPADPTTAASTGYLPDRFLDALAADALRGARIGILTDLLGDDPEEMEVSELIRAAAAAMAAQGAAVLDVRIAGLDALLAATYSGVIRDEFRDDLDAYLAAHPTAPVRSLAEIVASGHFHPDIEYIMRRTLAIDVAADGYAEKLAHRADVAEAVTTTLDAHRLDALLYPSIRRTAARIGTGPQPGVNCQLAAQSGLPALSVPAGFAADGLPVGAELLGRAWSDGRLLGLAFAFEQATHHRRPPALV